MSEHKFFSSFSIRKHMRNATKVTLKIWSFVFSIIKNTKQTEKSSCTKLNIQLKRPKKLTENLTETIENGFTKRNPSQQASILLFAKYTIFWLVYLLAGLLYNTHLWYYNNFFM